MKFAIVLALWFNLTANAQKVSPDADSVKRVIAPVQFSHADTLQALQNLFKSRRNTGGILAGGSAAVIAITGIGTAMEGNSRNCGGGYFCPDAFGSMLVLTVGTAPAWLAGLGIIDRFSVKHEKLAMKEYEKSGHLPHKFQKRLATRFFNPNYRFTKPSKKRT